MEDMESTVVTEAQGTDADENQLADDAQATEVSIEEVLAGLNGGEKSEAETVENEGDDGRSEQPDLTQSVYAAAAPILMVSSVFRDSGRKRVNLTRK